MLKIAAALALCATPVMAEGWQVMYLADSGGSRPMQVGPNDGGIPFPYVENDRGERLLLQCRWTGDAMVGHDWTLKFYPGQTPTVLPKDATGNRFNVAFDGDPTAAFDLGDFTYVQEAFWAPVPADVVAGIIRGSVVALEMPGAYALDGKPYLTEFTLAGSERSIDEACPAL